MTSGHWKKFFTDAGIHATDASYYAALFTEHRMEAGMAVKLDRDLLRDIGIRAIGDQLLILRHAEQVCWNQLSKMKPDGPIPHVAEQPVRETVRPLDTIPEEQGENTTWSKKRKLSVSEIPLTPFSPVEMCWPSIWDPDKHPNATLLVDCNAAPSSKRPSILVVRVVILCVILLYFLLYDSEHLFTRSSGFRPI